MKVVALVTSSLLALAVVRAGGNSSSQQQEDDDGGGLLQQKGEEVSSSGVEEERLQSSRREEKLFAFFTTTSVKRLSTTTITAISTCLSNTASPACTGRRKRSLFNNFSNPTFPETIPEELLGSQVEAEELVMPEGSRVAREVVGGREGKRLTVWSTFSSTLTLTSTSYLAGTTVTISALCVAPGITAGCFGR